MARSNFDWIAARNPGTFDNREPRKGWRGGRKDRLRGFYNRKEARRLNPVYDGDGNIIVNVKRKGRTVDVDAPKRQSTKLRKAMVWNGKQFVEQLVPVPA